MSSLQWYHLRILTFKGMRDTPLNSLVVFLLCSLLNPTEFKDEAEERKFFEKVAPFPRSTVIVLHYHPSPPAPCRMQ